MRRVWVSYWLRPLVQPIVLAGLICVAVTLGIGHEVFVAQVFANMPSLTNVYAVLQFFTYAVLHTSFVVQTLLGVGAISFVWFVADGIRSVRSARLFAV
ncbi:hypothetical protein KKH81_00765 [Patescibacteria group bacterium]|nr:hypothetical protein [Patescibacteria group bacterium]